jgi:hypothetical protein
MERESIFAKEDGQGFYSHKNIKRYINLKLAAMGQPISLRKQKDPLNPDDNPKKDEEFVLVFDNFIKNLKEKSRLLADHLCPVDRRIQDFIDRYTKKEELNLKIELPRNTFILDVPQIARELSLPHDGDHYESEWISSFRISQGVLHNPKNDKRTTKGTFHVAEGGLPVPPDKKAVPVETFARILDAALNPPKIFLSFHIPLIKPKTKKQR